MSTRKICRDCKICRLRGEWTYFKGINLNPFCFCWLSLAALPATPFRGHSCFQRAAGVHPSWYRILPSFPPYSPFFWLGSWSLGREEAFLQRAADDVALVGSNALSLGGEEQEFKVVIVYSGDGTLCWAGWRRGGMERGRCLQQYHSCFFSASSLLHCKSRGAASAALPVSDSVQFLSLFPMEGATQLCPCPPAYLSCDKIPCFFP